MKSPWGKGTKGVGGWVGKGREPFLPSFSAPNCPLSDLTFKTKLKEQQYSYSGESGLFTQLIN